MEIEKITEKSNEGSVDAWSLANDILLEICILQKAQRAYADNVSELSITKGLKEDTEQRLVMLDFVGETTLRHMEEVQEKLTTLINLILVLQDDRK